MISAPGPTLLNVSPSQELLNTISQTSVVALGRESSETEGLEKEGRRERGRESEKRGRGETAEERQWLVRPAGRNDQRCSR